MRRTKGRIAGRGAEGIFDKTFCARPLMQAEGLALTELMKQMYGGFKPDVQCFGVAF
jgi:hypothetical protein